LNYESREGAGSIELRGYADVAIHI